jgi:hypothetical protein
MLPKNVTHLFWLIYGNKKKVYLLRLCFVAIFLTVVVPAFFLYFIHALRNQHMEGWGKINLFTKKLNMRKMQIFLIVFRNWISILYGWPLVEKFVNLKQ